MNTAGWLFGIGIILSVSGLARAQVNEEKAVEIEEEPSVPLVTFSPAAGVFTDALTVTLNHENPDAAIYYTMDGSMPSHETGSLYKGPIKVTQTVQLRALALLPNDIASESESANYVKVTKALADYQSPLPIMIIDTLGKGKVPGKGWNQTGVGITQVARMPALWMLFDRKKESGLKARMLDKPQLSNRIGIRERGSFSSTWRQKQYSVEAWDGADDDKDVTPLGMPEEADWCLYYPDPGKTKDRTLIYNAFMWKLSALAGRYAPRFRWVEAFINEDGGPIDGRDRRGVYAIVEKVSRGKSRIPFEKLSDDGSTGGWLLSINRMDAAYYKGWPAPNGATQPQFFHTAGPDRILQSQPNAFGRGDDIPRLNRAQLNFESPSGYKILPAQRAAIEGWFKEFEDVLYDDERWQDPTEGYAKYIDAADFVDFFIFNNLAQNFDGLLLSIYPWRSSEDGRLRLGPTWDFNYSCYQDSGSPSRSVMNQRHQLWFGRLFDDPAFMQLYQERWQTLRAGALSNASMSRVIVELKDEIGDANAVAQGISSAEQWHRRLRTMENWLHQRGDWLDRQFPSMPEFPWKDGAVVQKGTPLTITAPRGQIYFTLDGSDPREGRLPAASAQEVPAPGEVVLLRLGALAKAHVPTNDQLGNEWMAVDFNDREWLQGKSGIGYDREHTYRRKIGLDLQDQMRGKRTSFYARIPFDVDLDPKAFLSLTLNMAYDDGFIAYLNGKRVASERAPEEPAWNARALSKNNDQCGITPTAFVITKHLSHLRQGTNVLAIQGLNDSVSSSDLLAAPTIAAGVPASNEGAVKLTEDTTITARVYLNGLWSQPAKIHLSVASK